MLKKGVVPAPEKAQAVGVVHPAGFRLKVVFQSFGHTGSPSLPQAAIFA